jgi:hypothetical protein
MSGLTIHLAQMDSLDHFLYDAYNNHDITAPENFIITNGYVMNSQHPQSPMAADRPLEMK